MGHYNMLASMEAKAKEVLKRIPLPKEVRIDGKVYKVLGLTEPWDGQWCEPRAYNVKLRLEGGRQCHAPFFKVATAYTGGERIEYTWR